VTLTPATTNATVDAVATAVVTTTCPPINDTPASGDTFDLELFQQAEPWANILARLDFQATEQRVHQPGQGTHAAHDLDSCLPAIPPTAGAYPGLVRQAVQGASFSNVELPKLNDSVITTSILQHNFPLAIYLIGTGSDINAITLDNETALTAAIRVRNPHMVHQLVAREASQLVQGNICKCGGVSNANALVAAAEVGDELYIESSLTLGRLINLPGTLSQNLYAVLDNNRFCRCATPLTAAVLALKHSTVVALLRKGGRNALPTSRAAGCALRPIPPLSAAIVTGDDNMVILLLSSGMVKLDEDAIRATYERGGSELRIIKALICHWLVANPPNPVDVRLGSLLLHSLLKQFSRFGDLAPSSSYRKLLNAVLGIPDIAVIAGGESFGGDPPSPLYTASIHGCLDLLKLLEQAGADFNAPLWYRSSEDGPLQSMSVLRLAVQHNLDAHWVTYLLQLGAHDRRNETETMTLVELSAKNRNLAVTKLLLSRNFDVNSATGTHRTALQHAVINGDAATVRLLLQYGADVNLWVVNDPRAPLDIATQLKRFDIVQLLLGHGADPDGRSNMIAGSDKDTYLTPLQIAAKAGSLEIVHVLLQYKAKPNRRSPIWYKGVAAHVDAFLSPLQLAISANNLAVIEALLAHGADVNDRACGRTLFDPAVSLLEARQTPLQMAVSNKNAEAVNILLGYSKPADGWSHLPSNKDKERSLLAGKPQKPRPGNWLDVNAPAHQRGGATALQYAAMVGSVSIAEALLARGANVNAPAAEQNGRTAVEAAAENGHLEVMRLLLRSGVIVYRADYAKAMSLARSKGHTEMIEFLKKKFHY